MKEGVARLDLRTPLYHAAGAQRALDLVFYECQMDSACRTAYPDLRSDWQAILQRLDEGVLVSTGDAGSGEAQTGARRVQLALDFFANPVPSVLDASCVATMVPPPFALPSARTTPD